MSPTEQTMLQFATIASRGFEFAGIAVIIIGSLFAGINAVMAIARLRQADREAGRRELVPALRKTLGRSILIGLELLVAADIIRTVAIEPTLRSVLVLGLIVIIRTFLSFSLEVEIDGKWPWQQAAQNRRGRPGEGGPI